jgi:hypothetical protein
MKANPFKRDVQSVEKGKKQDSDTRMNWCRNALVEWNGVAPDIVPVLRHLAEATFGGGGLFRVAPFRLHYPLRKLKSVVSCFISSAFVSA